MRRDYTLKNMNTFLVLGSDADGQSLMEDCFASDVAYWTLHKDAQIGDRILFYITAPISAVVAMGKVSSEPEYQPNPNEHWYKHWLGEVSELEVTNTTAMRELRQMFPEWKQLFYLRQNARVPGEIVEPLLELLRITE